MGIDRAEPLPGLRAWITAHCHLSHGQKSVCCEQIAFYLTGKVTGRFRNTVFPPQLGSALRFLVAG